MSFVYWKSEAQLWTVGYYRPDGSREPESDHASFESAAARCHYLNGGQLPEDTTIAHLLELEQSLRARL